MMLRPRTHETRAPTPPEERARSPAPKPRLERRPDHARTNGETVLLAQPHTTLEMAPTYFFVVAHQTRHVGRTADPLDGARGLTLGAVRPHRAATSRDALTWASTPRTRIVDTGGDREGAPVRRARGD